MSIIKVDYGEVGGGDKLVVENQHHATNFPLNTWRDTGVPITDKTRAIIVVGALDDWSITVKEGDSWVMVAYDDVPTPSTHPYLDVKVENGTVWGKGLTSGAMVPYVLTLAVAD
jgi:hypothetical protein